MKSKLARVSLLGLVLAACSPNTPTTEDSGSTANPMQTESSSTIPTDGALATEGSDGSTTPSSEEAYPYDGPIQVGDLQTFATTQRAPVIKFIYMYYRPQLLADSEIVKLYACHEDTNYIAKSENEFEFADYIEKKRSELNERINSTVDMMRANTSVMPTEGTFRFSVPFKMTLGNYNFDEQAFDVQKLEWQMVGWVEAPHTDCRFRSGNAIVKMPETHPGAIGIELPPPTGLSRVPVPEQQARDFLNSRTKGSFVDRTAYLNVTFDVDLTREDHVPVRDRTGQVFFAFTPEVLGAVVKDSQFKGAKTLADLGPDIFADQ